MGALSRFQRIKVTFLSPITIERLKSAQLAYLLISNSSSNQFEDMRNGLKPKMSETKETTAFGR